MSFISFYLTWCIVYFICLVRSMFFVLCLCLVWFIVFMLLYYLLFYFMLLTSFIVLFLHLLLCMFLPLYICVFYFRWCLFHGLSFSYFNCICLCYRSSYISYYPCMFVTSYLIIFWHCVLFSDFVVYMFMEFSFML